MTTSYEFLERLHAVLQPHGYLEIGVRDGDSLRLAQCPAIGIDPAPTPAALALPNAHVYAVTSDDFFGTEELYHRIQDPIDLAYIDGMHLIENALRDFLNIQRYANNRTVVVFDDVLPYSQEIAGRVQPAGDWTGDVWKVRPLLGLFMPGLEITMVDVSPCGAMMVTNLVDDGVPEQAMYMELYLDEILGGVVQTERVPTYVLNRQGALSPGDAIEWIFA